MVNSWLSISSPCDCNPPCTEPSLLFLGPIPLNRCNLPNLFSLTAISVVHAPLSQCISHTLCACGLPLLFYWRSLHWLGSALLMHFRMNIFNLCIIFNFHKLDHSCLEDLLTLVHNQNEHLPMVHGPSIFSSSHFSSIGRSWPGLSMDWITASLAHLARKRFNKRKTLDLKIRSKLNMKWGHVKFRPD